MAGREAKNFWSLHHENKLQGDVESQTSLFFKDECVSILDSARELESTWVQAGRTLVLAVCRYPQGEKVTQFWKG
jgi:hypothetical protein